MYLEALAVMDDDWQSCSAKTPTVSYSEMDSLKCIGFTSCRRGNYYCLSRNLRNDVDSPQLAVVTA
jgi:hypothetical protein